MDLQTEKINNIKIIPLHKDIVNKDCIPEPLPNFKTRSNFIMSIIACTGSGKSVLISNLIRIYYKNVFDKIYFCSSNISDDNKIYDNAYSSIIFDETRMFQTIDNDVANYIKLDIENDEEFIDDKPNFKALLIIDDLISEVANKRNKDLIKFIIKSRHLNCSIIIVSHKYNLLPAIVRANLTHIILFRTKSTLELEAMYKGIIDIDHETFMKLYHDATDENHSFLYSVLNKNPQLYYKNFDTKYIIDQPKAKIK